VPSLVPEEAKVIPRCLPTTTTPKRLRYLEKATTGLYKMAVATVEIKEERAPPTGYRAMHSSIKLVSIYDEESAEDLEIKEEGGSKSIPNRLITAEFELKHYERVYAMLLAPA
jgi:hypothetical protein